MRGCFLAFLLAFAATDIAGAQEALPGAPVVTAIQAPKLLEGKELVQALRRGGYSIFFRHARTDFTQKDQPGHETFSDCSRERNLDDAGREQSKRIGEALAALQVKVGDVIASPYCRTMDTARLMTGRATAVPAVMGLPGTGGRLDFEPLSAILRTPPAKGTNRVVVGHGGAWGEAVGGGRKSLAEGEAVVVSGPGPAAIVARVLSEDWEKLPRN